MIERIVNGFIILFVISSILFVLFAWGLPAHVADTTTIREAKLVPEYSKTVGENF